MDAEEAAPSLVQDFVTVTQATEDEAQFYLDAAGGSLETAINMYLAGDRADQNNGNRTGAPAQEGRTTIAQRLRSRYGEGVPEFEDTDWKEALLQAKDAGRLLLVYLHSEIHQDTDDFCRELMADTQFSAFATLNFVVWAGDVAQPGPAELANMLRVTTYPYVALLAAQGTRSDLQLLVSASIAGRPERQQLLDTLSAAQAAHVVRRTESTRAAAERTSAQSLRDQQDEALAASLAADREREEARRAAQEEAAASAAAAQREQDERRAAQEASEQALRDRADAIVRRREEKAAALPSEPESGTACTLIRVRLPTGGAAQRRFDASGTVEAIYDWVDSLAEVEIWDYVLTSTFPRREFERSEAADLGLEAAGLVPNAALMVTNRDD